MSLAGAMHKTIGPAYEPPVILETFGALEVMGSAEGFEVYTVGNGSQMAAISVAE